MDHNSINSSALNASDGIIGDNNSLNEADGTEEAVLLDTLGSKYKRFRNNTHKVLKNRFGSDLNESFD